MVTRENFEAHHREVQFKKKRENISRNQTQQDRTTANYCTAFWQSIPANNLHSNTYCLLQHIS